MVVYMIDVKLEEKKKKKPPPKNKTSSNHPVSKNGTLGTFVNREPRSEQGCKGTLYKGTDLGLDQSFLEYIFQSIQHLA